MPCPYVDVCTCTKGLEKSYIDVPIAVERKDAKRNMIESIRHRLQRNLSV